MVPTVRRGSKQRWRCLKSFCPQITSSTFSIKISIGNVPLVEGPLLRKRFFWNLRKEICRKPKVVSFFQLFRPTFLPNYQPQLFNQCLKWLLWNDIQSIYSWFSYFETEKPLTDIDKKRMKFVDYQTSFSLEQLAGNFPSISKLVEFIIVAYVTKIKLWVKFLALDHFGTNKAKKCIERDFPRSCKPGDFENMFCICFIKVCVDNFSTKCRIRTNFYNT